MRALTDLDDPALDALVAQQGGKPFQARQVAHWVFHHGARQWEDVRNIPSSLRDRLAATVPIRGSTLHASDASDDGTEKLLLRLHDGESVETVVIPDGDRITLCVSTQVGCPVACVFCASGLDGVRRNLTAGEIVEQVLFARDRIAPRALTNLVVMGLGEPMLNLDNLLRALERVHDPLGIDLGARRVTVSTSGHPERIARFADARHAYNLAVSLHAADDELRRRLVPTARAPVRAIVDAARSYFERKGREITFEVVLLAGVNDRTEDAQALIRVLAAETCTVNLIPWNPVDRIPDLSRPDPRRVDEFAETLRRGGLRVTVRRQRGADRSAACGQLRIRELDAAPRGDG